jgi:hypothetical protein
MKTIFKIYRININIIYKVSSCNFIIYYIEIVIDSKIISINVTI